MVEPHSMTQAIWAAFVIALAVWGGIIWQYVFLAFKWWDERKAARGSSRRVVDCPQAEAELGLARGTVDVWLQRRHIERAVSGRPALFWSDDLYDCKFERRRVAVH